ncbi:MAG: ATP-binding cassette domain-containing protein [Phycisphaerales bacterium]|nr:ATP-binding cassette domain-containing protein [Phycisphaerales bacterium]
MSIDDTSPALSVRNLSVRFTRASGVLRRIRTLTAVDDVSFDVAAGTTLGSVGESGCGQTTLARAIMRLVPATSGEVVVNGRDFLAFSGNAPRSARRHMQMVFQDPIASLNPRMTIERIVAEPLEVHEHLTRSERRGRVAEMLDRVGLPQDAIARYPHEFSGGQRQRVGIARALILRPSVVILDEPVSALDVSVQAEILKLLRELQKELHTAYVFIAHNLAVVRNLCDDVLVMFFGRIVESGPARAVLDSPQHPYTIALRAAAPQIGRRLLFQPQLTDAPLSPWNPPAGCVLHARCRFAQPRCSIDQPTLLVRAPQRPLVRSACHFAPVRDSAGTR